MWPNMRLKLAAPAFKGSVMFVCIQLARRSLSAIRWAARGGSMQTGFRHAYWALPAALLPIAGTGCHNCALGVPPFIDLEVRDSVTGLPTARGAVGVAQSGSVVDTLRPLDSALVLISTPLQPGTYTVTVTKSGYAPWVGPSVTLRDDPCAINSVRLVARLRPTP